ncbi:hypothetical protein ACC808_07740 [Rhizobium ruizarguesonis]
MPANNADTLRFIPAANRLDGLFCRYEQARLDTGMATTLARVSPRQRVDAIVTMLGLNASGWQRNGGENDENLWLRYLTPVLAETRELALALEIAARGGLPGDFSLPVAVAQDLGPWEEESSPAVPDSTTLRVLWQRRFALAIERGQAYLENNRVLAPLLCVGLCASVVGYGLSFSRGSDTENTKPPAVVEPRHDPFPPVPPPVTDQDGGIDESGEQYRDSLRVTLAAVAQLQDTATPRRLAEIYAAESRSLDEPAVFLSAMFSEWPLPVDLPIPHDRGGAYALTRYAETFAALQREEPVEPIRRPLDRASDEDTDLRMALTAFAEGATPDVPSGASTDQWMVWLRLLAFLPLLPVMVWARLSALPAFKAQLVNPAIGERGAAVELPAEGLVVTAPPPARRLARQISWREPGIARRMNVEASIRATIRRAGFLTVVRRRRRRPADYLFLVPRLRPDDHERERVSRFVDALRRGGLSLTVYDYDPDPRTVYPRTTPDAAQASIPAVTLDLRALRELHSEARLVLVTDGKELVDYFTQRALPFVKEELATWPARMLLTPVPLAEWGEREMNIAEALGALVGRATPEGFHDLELAFGEGSPKTPLAAGRPRTQATGEDGLLARLRTWLDMQDRLLGNIDFDQRRPAFLRFDDPILLSDAPPPQAEQEALVAELRAWLRPRGFMWLAACAAYPQLRFAITLYLGLTITIERGPVLEPLYDERTLAQLTLLPWFRIGRMPPWIRYALFDGLTDFSRQRIRGSVSSMLDRSNFDPQDLPPEARLQIWRPDNLGIIAPVDAVMADLMFRDMSEVAPVLKGGAFSAVFRDAMRRVRRMQALVVANVALWCVVASWLWPRLDGAPHAAGIWLPLIAFLGATAVIGLLAATFLRERRRGVVRAELLETSP